LCISVFLFAYQDAKFLSSFHAEFMWVGMGDDLDPFISCE
jgi:hypothetical protein